MVPPTRASALTKTVNNSTNAPIEAVANLPEEKKEKAMVNFDKNPIRELKKYCLTDPTGDIMVKPDTVKENASSPPMKQSKTGIPTPVNSMWHVTRNYHKKELGKKNEVIQKLTSSIPAKTEHIEVLKLSVLTLKNGWAHSKKLYQKDLGSLTANYDHCLEQLHTKIDAKYDEINKYIDGQHQIFCDKLKMTTVFWGRRRMRLLLPRKP